MFEEAGLDVTTVPMTGAGTVVTALSNNSIDVVDQSPIVAAKYNQDGGEARLFCGTTDRQWGSIVRAAGGAPAIADGEDWKEAVRSWKGMSFGVPVLQGAVHFWTLDIIEEAGLSSDDLDFIATGVGEAALSSLETGQVDLLWTWPFLTQMLGDRGEVVFDVAEQAPDQISDQMQAGWIANARWLDENPDAAQAFCETMESAIDFVQNPANASEVEPILQDAFGVDGQTAALALAEDGPMIRLTTTLSCNSLMLALEGAVRHGQVAETPEQNCDTLLSPVAAAEEN
ncbi:hypothetical protein A6035_13880 [Dietzia lutea]|uniref:Uncharacterized protein n=2 Tax=Dietzia lutea TaxID=546160 RepID=A0A2S1R9V9_9ACTN|nr:hypothetical protein A6035_13880 [Dietzia lutea]